VNILSVFHNTTLLAALSAWAIAQILKLPIHYLREKEIDWALLFRAGGMPSSHSAIVASAAYSIGLHAGFDTPLFTLAFVIAMIVIYDATGVRRQAGLHARAINMIVKDLVEGHPLRSREKFIEILGHSPWEATFGVILGIVTAHILYLSEVR
jgi:acid phosphatase family membrane protein YuiD